MQLLNLAVFEYVKYKNVAELILVIAVPKSKLFFIYLLIIIVFLFPFYYDVAHGFSKILKGTLIKA